VDVLKIDVPADATDETPWRITRQSRQSYYRLFRPEGAQADAERQWVHLDYDVIIDWETLEPDSDIAAFLRDRAISVTPLSHDLTSRVDFGALERLLHRPDER
jgi:5'-nucleotidase